ncbi:MAG TPA: transposase [Candidatus Acidoferrales bacterium]|nr:transposase [Candidatus Acidoferrales bacterium]
MGRISRNVRQAGAYFVTTDTYQRRALFSKPAWAELLCAHIVECRDRGFYSLHAFVVMPDHLHILLTPGNKVTIEKAIQMIKGGSAFKIRRQFETALQIWHAGFHDHWIRNDNEYGIRSQYRRTNPVEARLCESPEQYPWSSFSGKFLVDRSRHASAIQGLKPPLAVLTEVAAKAATHKAINS